MRKIETMLLLCGAVLAVQAGAADATPYSLDYAVISAGGANSSSAHYSAVTLVQTEGVALVKAESSSYSIEAPSIASDSAMTPVQLSVFSVE